MRIGSWSRGLAWAALGAAAAAAVASCGSGLVAGIEGTGAKVASVSSGPISRFGSIFVNGVEYDVSAAAVLVNGEASTATALQAGDVVVVRGSIDPGGTTGTATQVDFHVSVAGPVAAASASASTLTVLGQTVRIGTQTSLVSEAGGTPTFASFTPGSLVEVSGFEKSNGVIAATRVELKSQIATYRISGSIGSVDTARMRFTMNAATLEYAGAAMVGFPSSRSPQAGDVVQVDVPPANLAGVLPATRVALIAPVTAAAGDQGRIDGEITRFASAADFDVEETHVTTNAQTQYRNGSAAQLATDAHVSVQGSFDSSGTLTASVVSFQAADPILLQGPVEAVDPAANTLTVLGVAVTTDARTQFEDESAYPVSPFNLAAIAVGDYVEIHGQVAGGQAVAAGLLTREEPAGEVQVRGPATAVTAPDLTVVGVPAVTSATTQFYGQSETPITSTQFFAAAAGGATVTLGGTWSGGVLQVTTASLPDATELED